MFRTYARYFLLIFFVSFAACHSEKKDTQNSAGDSNSASSISAVDRAGPGIRGAWPTERSYKNDYFGFEVQVPDGWFLSKGQDDKRNEDAANFLSGEDKNLKGALENAIKKTVTLFWAYRYPPGTPGKSNPNVSITLENIERFPGITTAAEYLQALENTLKMTNRSFIFKGPASVSKLGELELMKREAEAPIGNLKVHQQFFALLKERTILLIGVTSLTPEDEQELSKLVSTFKPLASK